MAEYPMCPHNHCNQRRHGSPTVCCGQPTALAFAYDLTLDEMRRRTAIVEVLGDEWDPTEALAEEEMAYRMLYSDLDDEQQRIFDELVRAGVLPDRT